MKKITQHILVGILLYIVCPVSAFASGNLEVEEIRPSIPTSSYNEKYVENNQGQLTRTYEKAGWLGATKRNYQLYVPDFYKPDTAYPVVVLLHGSQRTGVSLVEKWIPLAKEAGLILIGPTHPLQGWPVDMNEADIIEGIINDVGQNYHIDRRHLYLFGHSSGGRFASAMPYLKPDLFTAIVVNAGALQSPADYKLNKDDRKVPIAFLAGSNDTSVPINDSANSAEFYAKHGHDTLFVDFLQHNHWYYTIAPEINRRALAFMIKYKK